MKQVKMLLILAAIMMVVTLFVGCEKSYKDKKPGEVSKSEQKIKQAAEKKMAEKKKAELAKNAPKADDLKHTAVDDLECWGKVDAKAKTKNFVVAGVKYEISQGYYLKALNADAKKPLVFGLLSDIKSNISKNMDNLNYFFKEFKKSGVNVVVVSGDTAEEYSMLKPLFDYIGKQGYLTLVVLGNREKKDAYVKAMTEAQAKYSNLINMNRIRLADLGAVTVASLPGYYDVNFIHNRPGCEYSAVHVDGLKKMLSEVKKPVVLLSHGPPRGRGANSIDNAVEAGNVGDTKMTRLIMGANIPFGFFGNIHEAGGKAVGPDFKTVLTEGQFFKKLYIHPGAADSDPWKMNNGSISRGMAGTVTIKDGKAAYKIFKAKAAK